MTSKELLHRLVEDLGEPQATEALTWMRARYALPDPAENSRELPEWVGAFASGRGDLAERHEELLCDLATGRGGCLSYRFGRTARCS